MGLNGEYSIGCLVIHGFGGCVDEISPLAARLRAKGYTIVCPRLKGHTGKRSDLKKAGYTDWIASAEQGLLDLLSRCRSVYIIGFSMGGLIAVNLALKYDLAGMVTINTPIYYWDVRRILSNIAYGFTTGDFSVIRRYINSAASFPLPALLNFHRLLNRTKRMVNDVICPVFITQGVDDDTVKTSSADYLFNNVNSPVKRLKLYERSGHLMLWSPAARHVIRDIEGFLQETH